MLYIYILYRKRQCAAVSSHNVVTTDPPHMGYVFSLNETCQGTAAIDVLTPATILRVGPIYVSFNNVIFEIVLTYVTFMTLTSS